MNYAEMTERLNAECDRLGLERMDDEQIEALADPTQCFGMIDDLEARCDLRVDDVRAALLNTVLLKCAKDAEQFVRGFEDVDCAETLAVVTDLLANLRAAIQASGGTLL